VQGFSLSWDWWLSLGHLESRIWDGLRPPGPLNLHTQRIWVSNLSHKRPLVDKVFYGIPSTRNSVRFFHFRIFRILYGISKIPRNCTEFRVAEFRLVSQNSKKNLLGNFQFFKKTYENVRFFYLLQNLPFLRHKLFQKRSFK
jgi:hypothetical protein